MAMLTAFRTVLIEWGDCDPAGIVYFPRYVAWFDNCTHELFRRAGFEKYEMQRRFQMVGIPMVDVRAKFYIPSRYGEFVDIESKVTEFKRSSFHVQHRMLKGDRLAAEGFETRVWVVADPDDPAKIRSQPIPQELIDKFLAGE